MSAMMKLSKMYEKGSMPETFPSIRGMVKNIFLLEGILKLIQRSSCDRQFKCFCVVVEAIVA